MESIIKKELPKRLYVYGETGTGKSLLVRYLKKKMNSEVYLKSPSGSWEGYKGEKIVLINDMTSEEWKYIKFNLKKWIDYDTFISSPVKDRMTKMEIKDGEHIDPSEYTLIITSYKSLEEFLDQERLIEEGKGLSERDVDKIRRLLEVHELKHKDIKEIEEDIKRIIDE